MTYDPVVHHRRSIRLKNYEYTTPGWYFVTIVVQDRISLFGEVVDAEMHLNDAGEMVARIWSEIPEFYPGVGIDSFVVMPNHLHGIIVLHGEEHNPSLASVGADPLCLPSSEPPAKPLSLGDVVRRFKSLTTREYGEGVKHSGWPPFNQRLWQRNYFEHVVRDERDVERLQGYIIDNPVNWAFDVENLQLLPV